MPQFIMPDQVHTPAGDIRHVGIELEMAGLDLMDMAKAVAVVFGGQVTSKNSFEIEVTNSRYGTFHIELDASLLKDHAYLDYLAKIGIEPQDLEEQKDIESTLSRLARSVVPSEVVAPPIPVTALAEMDTLRQRLHQAGAKGTRAALIYAFGAQFNIETASASASYFRDILRAYVLLHDRLSERGTVDIARKVAPYIRAFPGEYIRLILSENYAPSLTDLIGDYLLHNPTRNRPLDMLPLFAHLAHDQVMAAPVETHLIKPRPTFHYRLPNCQIDEPDWSLDQPWNDWVMVEKLAADTKRLAQHCHTYLEQPGEIVAGMVDEWMNNLGKWLNT
ncbi:amidoligase family protein [Desulfobulbus alkaliphilus]|uniref:amidoligase family protein n=1 Tax=Desulfobulbus alkaliphilus TaxID=869814 RepID=UPI00196690BB|nr:amidoligase family protein [Desulfobulbus alkaliphilus]MBM9536071.1 amidoligase family protein [Desulfobulbus alkaliphilus]